MLKEVIRTSGDVRRVLAQTMVDVRCGDLSVDKALAVAHIAKEITSSIQAEVNVAKVRSAMLNEGKDIGRLTAIGKMVIEEEGSTPTLSGLADE